jgi:hypothetical protein
MKVNLLEQVWQKAKNAPGLDPELFRLDEEGSMIRKSEFNNESSIYGWCFFHLQPVWEGGNNDIWNIKPLSVINKILFIAGDFNRVPVENQYWD